MLHGIAAIAAGLIFLIAQLVYLRGLQRSITDPDNPLRPRIVSWVIWISLDTLTFWGMVKDPATSVYALGQITGAMIGGWILFLSVARYTKASRLKRYEYVCLVLGALGLISSVALEGQVLTVLLAQLGGTIGSIPTIASVRENPRNEPTLPWVMFLVSFPLQILSIKNWSLVPAIQILGFVGVQLIVVYYIALCPWIAARKQRARARQRITIEGYFE